MKKNLHFGRRVQDMIKQTNMIMITTQNIINSSLPISIYDYSTNKFSLSSKYRQIPQIFLKTLLNPADYLYIGPKSHKQVVLMPIMHGRIIRRCFVNRLIILLIFL